MATTLDISKVGNIVQVKWNATNPICFSHANSNYRFSPDGLRFYLVVNARNYDCLFSELTITGAAPASVAAAYTSLSTIFPA